MSLRHLSDLTSPMPLVFMTWQGTSGNGLRIATLETTTARPWMVAPSTEAVVIVLCAAVHGQIFPLPYVLPSASRLNLTYDTTWSASELPEACEVALLHWLIQRPVIRLRIQAARLVSNRMRRSIVTYSVTVRP